MATGSRAGSRFGQYELRRLLGVGGMGEVYEAYDLAKERTVALKLLDVDLARDPIYVERFRRESFAAARLQEPHVIPVHDWGDIDGVLYIDMRLVAGHDLKEQLRGRGPLAPADAVSMVEQIASALDAAHETGLIHRDVKPANILLTRGSFAYLVDFGIAHSESDVQLTGTGSAVGSFAYMAPERFENVAPTAAIDIYSLTCVLYECLTGRVPFPATSFAVAIHSHQMAPPPRPSASSGALAPFDHIVARGMAKNPRDRYRTAGEMAEATRAALAHVGHGATVTSAGGQAAVETRIAPTGGFSGPQPTLYNPLRTHPSAPLPIPPPAPQGGGRVLPVVIAALGAALVVLLVVLVAWVAVASRQTDPPLATGGPTVPSAGPTASATASITSVAVTTGVTTQAVVPPPVPSTTRESPPALVGAVAGADEQGFASGPRCNGGNPAYAIGRTGASRVVVCRTGVGRYYYKGVRVSDNAAIELDDPAPTGDGGFVATNPKDGTQYRIAPSGLVVVQNGRVVANETMLEFAHR